MLLPTMLLRIIVAVAIMLAALGLGLWLRYLTVSKLRKTILDNWVIQTLGVLVIIPALILGFIVIVVVSDPAEQNTILGVLRRSPLGSLMGTLGTSVIN